MLNRCFATSSLDALRVYFDPRTIDPVASNTALSFSFDRPGALAARPLHVLKPETDRSLAQLLDDDAVDASADDARLLRELIVSARALARECSQRDGEPALSLALACVDDPSFTGAMMFNVAATPKKAELFGDAALVGRCSFFAPCLRVEGIALDAGGGLVESGAQGLSPRIAGCVQGLAATPMIVAASAAAGFVLRLDRMTAQFVNSTVISPSLDVSLSLKRLFEAPVADAAYLKLHGTYVDAIGSGANATAAYGFSLRAGAELRLAGLPLASVSVEGATATSLSGTAGWNLRLQCSGKLRFAAPEGAYDPFGFGPSAARSEDGYLSFTGLDLSFALPPAAPRLTTTYRTIVPRGEVSRARAGSFAASVPHGSPWFLCHQDGGSPEDLGYHAVAAPIPGGRLSGAWFGLVLPLDLMAGLRVELLFGFDAAGTQYAGARFPGAQGAASTSAALSHLFSIKFQDIAIHLDQRETGTDYSLLLRGLKANALRMELPEGSCNLALLPRADATGWYAVYDNLK